MTRESKIFSSAYKAKVALATVREDCTTSELAATHKKQDNQIARWKSQLLARGAFDCG